MVEWIELNSQDQLTEIKQKSSTRAQIIFKHSTRCSISSMALNRLQRSEVPGDADFYLLDLIRFRNISNAIATEFGVAHESPQVLVIKNGTCTYNESHMGIDMKGIQEQVA